MTDFPYPGDDPGALAYAASTFDVNVSNMHTLIGGVNTAESNIKGNWVGDTATAASGDVSKINEVLHLTVKDFTASKTALETLRSALVPIRHQIDDLRRQLKQAQLALGAERDEYGRADRFGEINGMSKVQVANYRHVLGGEETKSQGAITHLTTEYHALVTKANKATSECSDALKATISGQTYDPNTGGVKSTKLDDILGLDGLSLLHRYQAGVDAATAATEAKKLLGLQPRSAAAVKLAAELAKLLNKYPDGDPDFSVPFLKSLGQDNLLKLTAYVAGIQGTDPSVGQNIGAIQRDLGSDLAAATHLLGKPNPGQVQQLDQAWVKTLLGDGGKGYETELNGYYPTVKGFQSLGVLLRTGNYGSGFLSESGDALMDYEKKEGQDSNTWLDLGGGVTNQTRLWWGAGDGKDVPRGLDPFDGWVAGMSNSSEAKQVLYDDVTPGSGQNPPPWMNHGLLNYLLDHRDWSLNDMPHDSAFGHFTDGQPQVGLEDLGSMLDQKIGFGAIDPQSQKIFQSIVTDLGSNSSDDNGARINANGGFGSNDWVPPELRRYLGDITARNIDSVHNVFSVGSYDPHNTAGNNDQNDYSRFIADLGKDPGAGNRIFGAEKVWAQHEMSQPDGFHSNDADAFSRVSALLTHGHTSANTATQDAADHDYNDRLDTIRSAVDAASSIVDVPGGPVAGAAVDFVKGQFLDSIFAGMQQDHSGATAAANSNYAAYMNTQTTNDIGTAAYGSLTDKDLAGLGDSTYFHDGQRVPYSSLSVNQVDALRTALEKDYPGNRALYEDVFNSGSHSETTVTDMEAYAASLGLR